MHLSGPTFVFRQPWFDRDHGFGGLSGDLSVALR